jgi:hypothetical protein
MEVAKADIHLSVSAEMKSLLYVNHINNLGD